MTFKPPNGLTTIELLIALAIAGIGLSVALNIINGSSAIPTKQQCLSAGGKWSEGIQYGRITQLCTYN